MSSSTSKSFLTVKLGPGCPGCPNPNGVLGVTGPALCALSNILLYSFGSSDSSTPSVSPLLMSILDLVCCPCPPVSCVSSHCNLRAPWSGFCSLSATPRFDISPSKPSPGMSSPSPLPLVARSPSAKLAIVLFSFMSFVSTLQGMRLSSDMSNKYSSMVEYGHPLPTKPIPFRTFSHSMYPASRFLPISKFGMFLPINSTRPLKPAFSLT